MSTRNSTIGLKERPLVTVLLVDGPCAGRYEQVAAFSAECWTRVGPPGGIGVESQMWARYDRATRGTYRYAGITITTDQMQNALAAMQRDGHTYGESYGA
jgi:hypothetical protein